MRRRITTVALLSAVLAVLLFALPLTVVFNRLYTSQALGSLERSGLQLTVQVGAQFTSGDPAELPASTDIRINGLYNVKGILVSGSGPKLADSPTQVALRGGVGHAREDGWLVVSVPFSQGEHIIGAVRVAEPTSVIATRLWKTLAAIAIAGAVAIAVALMFGRWLARRLSRPLEALALTSRTLGQGQFELTLIESGVPEIDEVSQALVSAGVHLGDLITRERLIASNASHQLRTPLTGLRASLEAALNEDEPDLRRASEQAIAAADRLAQTIDDLLLLAREPWVENDTDLATSLEAARERWTSAYTMAARELAIIPTPALPTIPIAPDALNQILDVLIDNALNHGSGTTRVTVRRLDDVVAIDVSDMGSRVELEADIFTRGVSTTGSTGIGLSLARGLAEDQGARLILSQKPTTTTFTLLVQLHSLQEAES